ncbi:hypothetical protein Tco_1048624 [Tanacetum coccineum]
MKKLIKVVPDEEEVVIDAIPLATKPPSIIDWKIVKEEKISLFQIIRANGSSKRYSSMIQMLRDFDSKDLETLWKLVKAKHRSTRPEEGYERVLWGDLRTMFQDMHLFMLVEKRYPLTPATITEKLNKKLQTDHLNEMCYQLLKLMTKQLKNPESGRIVGIKRLHDDLRVTTAQLVLMVQSYNCLFIVNDAGTKLQLLKDYNCSRIKTAEKIKIDWRSRILTSLSEEEGWNRIKEYIQYQDDSGDDPPPPMNVSSISKIIKPTLKGGSGRLASRYLT